MIGDSMDDAPALASASVGIAMGAAGSDLTLRRPTSRCALGLRHRGWAPTRVVAEVVVATTNVATLLTLPALYRWWHRDADIAGALARKAA